MRQRVGWLRSGPWLLFDAKLAHLFAGHTASIPGHWNRHCRGAYLSDPLRLGGVRRRSTDRRRGSRSSRRMTSCYGQTDRCLGTSRGGRQRRSVTFLGPPGRYGPVACRCRQERMDRRGYGLRGRRYSPARDLHRSGGGKRHRPLGPGGQTPSPSERTCSVGRLWRVVRWTRRPLVGFLRSCAHPWDAATRCCCRCARGRAGAGRASGGKAVGALVARPDPGSAQAVDPGVRCPRNSGRRGPGIHDGPSSAPVVQRWIDALCGLAQRGHA